MRFSITSVDYAPDELYHEVPIRGRVLRQIPGRDRPDYFLAKLDRPLRWKREGDDRLVTHIILAARWAGGVLTPTMRHMPVGIAYVVDRSLLSDAKLDFEKSQYIAIGVADGEPASLLQRLFSWFRR
jgi:hypothetical protein